MESAAHGRGGRKPDRRLAALAFSARGRCLPFVSRGGRSPRPWLAALAARGYPLRLLLPVVTVLCLTRPTLEGEKIVIYKEGYLNWLKPEHGEYGRLSIGMYGMCRRLSRASAPRPSSRPTFRKGLARRECAGADLSNKPWAREQKKRIWDFVEKGGTLLLMGEHTVREPVRAERQRPGRP